MITFRHGRGDAADTELLPSCLILDFLLLPFLGREILAA
jgi:hypothetical protein